MMHSLRRFSTTLLAAALVAAPATSLAGPVIPAEPASIHGRILTADLEHPEPGLEIRAIPDGAREPAAEVRTDEDGRFHLTGLDAGPYTLVIARAGAERPLAAARVAAAAGGTTVSLALPGEGLDPALAPSASGSGFLTTWWGATIVLVGSAIVLAVIADDVTDDDDELEDLPPISPTVP